MDPNLYMQVKKMNKCLQEINSMGYMVFLEDGPHHQQMKVERRFKKKKEKKEKKAQHESFAIFGEWVSGGENQVQAQVMNQARNSPPALTWDHHPTRALWPKVWRAM